MVWLLDLDSLIISLLTPKNRIKLDLNGCSIKIYVLTVTFFRAETSLNFPDFLIAD